jgi:hypothetical protein
MKTLMSSKINVVIPVFVLLFMTSCDLFDTKKELTAEDAKMEIRAAGEDIMFNINEMMETPAMSSLLFFRDLIGIEFGDLKSAQGRHRSSFMRLFSQNEIGGQAMILPGISRVLNIARALNAQKSDQFEEYGVYYFNFFTNEFDLVNTNVDYVEYHYPSNEQAYDNQQRNAKLRISNIEILVVEVYDEYWDEYDEQTVPTSLDVTQWINNQVVMELTYRAAVNENALPISISLSMDMPPYSMTMSHTGSNRDYTTKSSLKINSSTLLDVDMRLRYTADQEEVEKADGSITVTPLRFKGNIKPSAIDECQNITCMNNNIDMEVFQIELDKKIGKLEFREYDGEFELVIVYKDGSYDFLSDIFDEIFEGF